MTVILQLLYITKLHEDLILFRKFFKAVLMEVLFIFSQLPMLAGGGMLIVSISPLKIIIGKLKNSGGQG